MSGPPNPTRLRRYQEGSLAKDKSGKYWRARWREDRILPEGTMLRRGDKVLPDGTILRRESRNREIGSVKEFPTERQARQELDRILIALQVNKTTRPPFRARSASAVELESPPSMETRSGMTIREQFGQMDIYLFDQLLRGNISPGMRVLDGGCGGGRNMQYLLREGYEVFGVDVSSEAVAEVRKLASELAPGLPAENFQAAGVEAMPFSDEFADVVVCHSVLHFAQDEAHLEAMVQGLWRVLRPGGMLFCRLASTIGAVEGMAFTPIGGRRFRMSHGAEWLLVDEALLMKLTRSMGGELLDPLKTTVVQGQRCMTTWVVKKKCRPGEEDRAFVSSGMPGRRR